MGAKIHLYPIERFQFGDDDYYDIDYFDGLVYQTAKIKGSTIKQGILDVIQIDTIYSADGSIDSDRTLTGTNANQLLFDQFRKIVFNTNPAPFGASGFEINSQPTGNLFTVKNAGNGDIILKVTQSGVQINNEYVLPLTDGSAGQFIQTDGSGQLSFASIPAGGDMLKSVYDPNNDGIIESARKEMVGFINKTGSTLLKGTIVYLKSSSSSTNFPEAIKANASTELTSSKTIGAVFEDVPNNQTGFIVTSGEVDNLDTTAYSIGQRLWLSTTDGLVTPTPPIQPFHSVFIGIVTRSQNINGRILYAIQNGYEITELHDVLISNPIDGQVLTYDSTSQLWKNESAIIPNQTNLDPVINLLSSPPASPTLGDRYRIGLSPTGLWSGQPNNLAEWNGSTWIFTIPILDNLVYQTATATTFRYNGSVWSQWAGTPILQNGNALGGIMRIGTNDNNSVYIKRNNLDVFIFGNNFFSAKSNVNNFFGTFNLQNVSTNRSWLLPDKNGTFAMLDDIAGFIPFLSQSEIRRGTIAISGSTNQGTFGGISPTITGTIWNIGFGGTTPLPKFRIYTTSNTTNSIAGIINGVNERVIRVGRGFRFIGSFIYSDQSAGGINWYAPNARQFCGLAASGSLINISSTVSVESQTSIIGMGSDVGDTNLQIFHNDIGGTCTKIDLGSNFPANKSGAVANGEAYQLELYNEFPNFSIKYRVRKLSDGTEVSGIITNNVPAAVDLGSQIIRTSGSSSTNVSIDVIQLTTYTRE